MACVGVSMNLSDPPVYLEECVNYLSANAWQLKHLGANDPVRINANILRSVLTHLKELQTRQSCDKREGA